MSDRILPRPKAVLFDLDGVLIDSMPHHVAAWQTIFSQFGVDIPAEVLRRSEGEKAKITIRRLAEEHGLHFSDAQLEELVEKKRRIYRQSAPRGLRPAARCAVEDCRRQGLKTAIVTGSVRPNIEWTLSLDERQLFDVIISSEICENSKPYPEPYLNAAERLSLAPADCLVIENAPLGIRSAKAAGMTCLAITTTLPADELDGADLIIPDLDHLVDMIDFKNTNKSGG